MTKYLNPYRVIVAIGFIIAMALMLATPLQLPDPDDWAYYHAVRNFSGEQRQDNDITMVVIKVDRVDGEPGAESWSWSI